MSSTLSSFKRAALSTHNRLSSIQSDAEFVASVSKAFRLPLVANERCGSWYIPPDRKAESVYFKSTDGHTNEWKFSLRRLNLQVLDLVSQSGGCIIVDSTRRGKSMPDALSKTIPIWCCVINRALFADSQTEPHELRTPPQTVSELERAQIEKRINGFVNNFMETCQPDIKLLREKLQKPLRPIWVTQTSSLPEKNSEFTDFHPVVLCTASRRVHGAEGSEGGYVQGAADDHEAWSLGLTPPLFWAHKERILSTNEEDVPDLIEKLIDEDQGPDAAPILVKPTSNLYISTTHNLDVSCFDIVISCTPESLPKYTLGLQKGQKYLHLKCQTGKLGSRDLRTQLKDLAMIEDWFPSGATNSKILICDPTGKDLAVGVALAILCNYADRNGTITFKPSNTKGKVDKGLIKQRLSWLTTTHPILNPPRATLQSVNAFLMPPPSITCASPTPTTQQPSSPSRKPQPSTPSVILSALANDSKPWTFTRTLTSKLPTHPSGTVTGTASFTPLHQAPTFLYAEAGEFVTATGLRFIARRKYIYKLVNPSEGDEYIAVHFHEEGKEAGGLFVVMGELKDGGKDLEAQNREQHLCAADLYTASWRFGKGLVGEDGECEWEVRYVVKGPKKDYVSQTRYTTK